MKKDMPLVERIYVELLYTELVRLIGYAGASVVEVQERVLPLGEKYGREKVQAAADELAFIDQTQEPPVLRLRMEVRPLCRQLLGLPPEDPWHELMRRPEPLPNSWDQPKQA